ncbi:IS3 family transposase [Streptomyces sp. 900116325]
MSRRRRSRCCEKRRSSSRRRAIDERGVRVHRGGEDHPPCCSVGPAAEGGPVLLLRLVGRRAGPRRPPGRRAADDALAHEITVLHLASRCTYGVPRIHAESRRLDRRVNRKRVERIMRERAITGVTRRMRRSLTRPAKRAVPAADLIGRDFTADAPGRKLVGDITYIPTEQGWLYLATWLDLTTREIVGYSMADHHRASLVVDALTTAAGRGRLQPGCIAHSDSGSEYTSDELRREIGRLGLRQSMGRTGSCYDNAAAESFFALLKDEIGTRH